MKNRLPLIITLAGLAATGYAVTLNLVTAVPEAGQGFIVQSLIFAVIAVVCGIYTLRKGGSWRFLAIAMIGPAVFVLTDAGMRLLLFAQHGA
jgi:ABC-type multidrug transport system permease subunit